jgi:hypothetical protein
MCQGPIDIEPRFNSRLHCQFRISQDEVVDAPRAVLGFLERNCLDCLMCLPVNRLVSIPWEAEKNLEIAICRYVAHESKLLARRIKSGKSTRAISITRRVINDERRKLIMVAIYWTVFNTYYNNDAKDLVGMIRSSNGNATLWRWMAFFRHLRKQAGLKGSICNLDMYPRIQREFMKWNSWIEQAKWQASLDRKPARDTSFLFEGPSGWDRRVWRDEYCAQEFWAGNGHITRRLLLHKRQKRDEAMMRAALLHADQYLSAMCIVPNVPTEAT